MIVVADTSPLNYLILIGHIDLLHQIYGAVVIPPAVRDELLSHFAPEPVRTWIKSAPEWLEIRTPVSVPSSLDPALGNGEREAISLAQSFTPSALLLIDERAARREAERLGLHVTGTLGILEEAHERGLVNMPDALTLLLSTNFKVSAAILERYRDQG